METKRTAAAVAGMLMCLSVTAGCGSQTQEPQLLDPATVVYSTCTVRYESLTEEVFYDASAVCGFTELYPGMSGTVEYLEAIPGDPVKKGDLLLKLADRSEERESLLSELERLKTEGERLDTEYEETLGSGMGGAALSRAEAEYEYLSGCNRVDIEAIERQLQTLEEEEEKTAVYAPFDGIVASVRSVSAGERIEENEPFLILADPSQVTIDTEYITMSAAEEAKTTKILYGDTIQDGEYAGAESEIFRNAAYRGYALTSSFFCETMPEFGEYAAVILSSPETEEVLAIEEEAIQTAGAQEYVYRMEDGRRVLTEIETGRHMGGLAEVLDGLEEGDEVCLPAAQEEGEKEAGEETSLVRRETYIQTFETQHAERVSVKKVGLSFRGSNGVLTRMAVRNGSEVAQGDLIAVIQPEFSAATERERFLAWEAAQREYDRIAAAGGGKEALEQARLSCQEAEERYHSYEALKQEVLITAPEDGIITGVTGLREGDPVADGTVIATMDYQSPWFIQVQDTGGSLRFGMEVTIVNEYRGSSEEYTGQVVSMYEERTGGDPGYCLVKIDGLMEEPEWGDITVRAVIKEMDDVILADNRAIYQEAGRYYVYRQEDGELRKIYITIAADNGSDTWVLSGLDEGDRLILK